MHYPLKLKNQRNSAFKHSIVWDNPPSTLFFALPDYQIECLRTALAKYHHSPSSTSPTIKIFLYYRDFQSDQPLQ